MKKRPNLNSRNGVLTFEWMAALALLVLGAVGGLAILRDALIVESAELAAAVSNADPSYSLANPVEMQLVCADSEGTVQGFRSFATGSRYSTASPGIQIVR